MEPLKLLELSALLPIFHDVALTGVPQPASFVTSSPLIYHCAVAPDAGLIIIT